jgi:hypothetical protein
MWTKKTAKELRKDSRMQVLKSCLATAFIAGTILVAANVPLGFHPSAKWRIAAGVAGASVLLGWWQRRRWRQVRSNVIVCENCNVIRRLDDQGDHLCSCGGRFVPLSRMKWLDSGVQRDPPDGVDNNLLAAR